MGGCAARVAMSRGCVRGRRKLTGSGAVTVVSKVGGDESSRPLAHLSVSPPRPSSHPRFSICSFVVGASSLPCSTLGVRVHVTRPDASLPSTQPLRALLVTKQKIRQLTLYFSSPCLFPPSALLAPWSRDRRAWEGACARRTLAPAARAFAPSTQRPPPPSPAALLFRLPSFSSLASCALPLLHLALPHSRFSFIVVVSLFSTRRGDEPKRGAAPQLTCARTPP